MNINLAHKTALVCGASQGIGKAVAGELAQLGCRVVALARSAEQLAALVAALPGNAAHSFLVHDLTHRQGLSEKIRQELAAHGPIEIVVINSGGPASGPLAGASVEDYLQAFQAHVLAALTVTELLLPGMRERGYGRILPIISTSTPGL